MSNRRVITLEKMYKRVAKSDEMAMIDRLYAEGHKGPAVRRMQEKVAGVFHALLDEHEASRAVKKQVVPNGFEELPKQLIRPIN